MTKYLIIDDEPIAHDIIKGYCDLLPGMELQKNCYDAIEALDYLREKEVDLIFLDLNMPKLKGFEFLRTLTHAPKIIVTTAYKEFALEGYELNIVDYLMKPFSFERFLKAVNKAKSEKKVSNKKSDDANEPSRKEAIFLYSDKKHIQVKLDDIKYAEAKGNYTQVVLVDKKILVREKISDMLEMLASGSFIRVHKSFIVAKEHISSIEGNRIFLSDDVVPIGKHFKENVVKLLKS